MARTINVGGYWTAERLCEAGYVESNLCTRCGIGAVDNELHRFWTCTANCNIDSDNIRNTQYLITLAKQQFREDPTLWGRGVAVNRMPLAEDEPMRPTSIIQYYRGMFEGDNGAGIYFTDGSGGCRSNDPRLRRVGIGVVKCSISDSGIISVHGGLSCSLEGWKQTVPRAELRAIVFALTLSTGHIIIYTDHINHVRKYNKGEACCINSELSDLWATFWDAYRARGGGVELRYVKAHALPEHFTSGAVTPFTFVGNGLADACADRGAEIAPINHRYLQEIESRDCLVAKINKRMVDIALALPRIQRRPRPSSAAHGV